MSQGHADNRVQTANGLIILRAGLIDESVIISSLSGLNDVGGITGTHGPFRMFWARPGTAENHFSVKELFLRSTTQSLESDLNRNSWLSHISIIQAYLSSNFLRFHCISEGAWAGLGYRGGPASACFSTKFFPVGDMWTCFAFVSVASLCHGSQVLKQHTVKYLMLQCQ